MDTRRTIEEMPLEGGHLALDFANTTGGLRDEPPAPGDEMLMRDRDLVTWAERAGLVGGGDAARLRRGADGTRAVAPALALRGAIYAAFRALADGREPEPAALAALRDAERDALRAAVL